MIYDSLIFDLDGTLWNPCSSVAIGWTNGAHELGIDKVVTPLEIESICGLEYNQCIQKIFPELNNESIAPIKTVLNKYEKDAITKHGGQLYPNVIDELKYLKTMYDLYIVSNCQEWYLDYFLEEFKLKTLIIDWESHGRTGNPKQDNISAVIHRNDIKSAVYIGDTDGDANAAKLSGTPFIYAAYGFGDTEATQKIDSICELKKLLL